MKIYIKIYIEIYVLKLLENIKKNYDPKLWPLYNKIKLKP